MQTTIAPPTTKEAIAEAFYALQTEKHVFTPEIKVKRRNDTLYISELRKTKLGILAMVEVGVNDKAPVPLGMLDERTLGAIKERICK